jgi:hypothetical protein
MQVTDEMVDAAWAAYQNTPIDLLADSDDETKRCVVNALIAALAAMWRPADDRCDGLLFFPRKVTGHHRQSCLPEMMKVGRASDFPNRQPTHFMPLPSPPKAEG